MRVAMALLVNRELCNSLARITMKCRDYGFGLRVLRLPPHVSLKQPFIVPKFEHFETYFDEFAASIEQQSITFDGFQFWAYPEGGVISVRVVKDGHLRELHTRLNSELEHRFGNTKLNMMETIMRFISPLQFAHLERNHYLNYRQILQS